MYCYRCVRLVLLLSVKGVTVCVTGAIETKSRDLLWLCVIGVATVCD